MNLNDDELQIVIWSLLEHEERIIEESNSQHITAWSARAFRNAALDTKIIRQKFQKALDNYYRI